MAHPVHPIKTGQCVPFDDISCGPYTIRVNIHITHYGCRLGPYKEFFLRDIYIPGFDIALALCRLLTVGDVAVLPRVLVRTVSFKLLLCVLYDVWHW